MTFRDEHGDDATKTVDYTYDPFNQLIKREVDPDGDTGSTDVEQTFYLYEMGQVVLQFDKTGSGNVEASDLSHRYLWGPAVDQLFADEQVDSLASAGDTYWALTDHLGSVRDVVDNSSELRIHRDYDSFGNVLDDIHYNASGVEVSEVQAGYIDEMFGFTGRQFDDETGLQNNLNRWYDPKTGRWISEDPIGFAAGDANLNRYVGNEPTGYIDPYGLQGGDHWLTHPAGGYGGQPGDNEETWQERREKLERAKVPIPRVDHEGVLHGPLPERVPEEWEPDNIRDALDEVEDSLRERHDVQEREGHDYPGPNSMQPGIGEGGHRGRIKRELDWRNKLRNALRSIPAPTPKQVLGTAQIGIGGYLMYVGGTGSAVIVADDLTVVGVANDPLLIATGGIFVVGGVLNWFGI